MRKGKRGWKQDLGCRKFRARCPSGTERARNREQERFLREKIKTRAARWSGARGGGIRLCGEHLQQFYSVYLTRFRTYKIALPPQTKPRRGGVRRQISTCRQVPLQVIFKEKTTFRVWCLYSYFVHAITIITIEHYTVYTVQQYGVARLNTSLPTVKVDIYFPTGNKCNKWNRN